MTFATINHGTEYGYQQHRMIGEQPCRACTDAHSAAGRERRHNDPAYKAAGKRRYIHSKLLAEFRDAAPDWYARLSKKYGAEWDATHQEADQ